MTPDEPWKQRDELAPSSTDGIAAFRWATKVDEVLAALGTPDSDFVTLLNSWGKGYPHETRMPA